MHAGASRHAFSDHLVFLLLLCIYIFLRTSSVGGVRCQTFYIFVLFSLFSRPRAGLATMVSGFFGLATNTLNVGNNNNSMVFNDIYL